MNEEDNETKPLPETPFVEGVFSMADDVYRRIRAINSSTLKVIAGNQYLANAKWELDHPKDTKPLTFGRALHALMEGDSFFQSRFALIPDNAPKRPSKTQLEAAKPSPATVTAIQWWKAWDEMTYGREPVEKADYERASAMRESILSNGTASSLLSYEGKVHEAVCMAIMDGQRVKCRADLLLPFQGILVDWKTSDGIEDDTLERAMWQFNYPLQSAFYKDVFRAGGHQIEDFVFGFVDSNPPHLTRMCRVVPLVEDYARRQYQKAIDKLLECVEYDEWPGTPDGIEEIGVPAWAMKKILSEDY